MLVNPKQIPDPDNEGQMIDNPDYDPTKNEDGTPIEAPEDEDTRTDAEKALDKAKTDFKDKMDKLNKRAKDAEDRATALEAAERKREQERLKANGQLSEAFELEKADLLSRLESLEAANTALSRDREVRDAMTGYEFRTAKAQTAAIREITDDLVKDEKGVWVAKSGESVDEYVKAFFEAEDNSYMLKPKRTSGTGADKTKPPVHNEQKPKSIFDLKPEQVMANILAGKPARG